MTNSRDVVVRGLRQYMAGSFCFFDSGNINTTFLKCARALPLSSRRQLLQFCLLLYFCLNENQFVIAACAEVRSFWANWRLHQL